MSTLQLLAHKTAARTGASGDGSLTKMTTATGDTISYSYDNLKRLIGKTAKSEAGADLLSTACAYRTISSSRTSAHVEYCNVKHCSSYYVKNRCN